MAGNFFREYIAPVATKYKEKIDLEAILTAGGTKKLRAGTVSGAWKRQLDAEGQSGAFADIDDLANISVATESMATNLEASLSKDDINSGNKSTTKQIQTKAKTVKKYKPLNKVIRNKGDPKAICQAKRLAKNGKASPAVQAWLITSKNSQTSQKRGLTKDSLLRFSDAKPPLILDCETVYKAVTHFQIKIPSWLH